MEGEHRYVDLGINSVGAIAHFDGLLVYRIADGKRLAVTRRAAEGNDVWIYNMAEVSVARFPSMTDPLQVSDGGSDAVWGDDRTLYYSTSAGITRVDLTGRSEMSVVKRTPVLRRELSDAGGHATFDVTRGGQLLVVALSASDTKTVVAYGWQHELRRKLAANAAGAK